MKLSYVPLFLTLTGCWVTPEYSGAKTTVEPHFVRAGIREDSLVFAVPLNLEPRITYGWRSMYEIRADVKVVKSLSNPSVTPPNGFVLSFRGRW